MQHPSGAGGAIWLWADQGLKIACRGPDGTSSSSLEVVDGGFDGITDSYRRPTRDYWETKAFYAQVVPAVKKIPIILGQPFVRIPIKNDFDFLNLAAIQISWALREDERQLSSGTTQISGPPHAVSWLDLPLDALEEIKRTRLTIIGLRSHIETAPRSCAALSSWRPHPLRMQGMIREVEH